MSSARIFVRLLRKQQAKNRTQPPSVVNKNDILVVGGGPLTELYLRSVDVLHSHRLNILGILVDSEQLLGRSIHGRQVLGRPSELPQILARLNIHGSPIKHVVITAPLDKLSASSQNVLRHYERSGIIHLDWFEKRFLLEYEEIESLNEKPIDSHNLGGNASVTGSEGKSIPIEH